MVASCLIVVDVQTGFINDWTREIPAKVTLLQRDYDKVHVSRFSNPAGSMHRRLIGWERFAPGSADTALAFDPVPGAEIIDKTVYSCVTPALLATLAAAGIEQVDLCGIATDGCVLKTAVDLFEAGIRPLVLADFCASHGGPRCHEAGLLLLRRFIGARQVVAADAAPGADS